MKMNFYKNPELKKALGLWQKISVLIVLLITTNRSFTANVVGSDISYQCTATPGVYQVTLKLFRDCSGAQLCANCPTALSSSCSMPIKITGVGGACNGTVFGTQNITVVLAISGFDVIQLCSTSICSNCGTRSPGAATPGYEVYTFQGNINLNAIPAGCCMVSLGYSTCCRNPNNASLMNAGTLPFYTEAIINRCLSPCNSSPWFTNDPVVMYSANREVIYNVGAVDPDGDSLSYASAPALTDRGVTAPYAYPYNAATFPFLINATLGMNVNQVNGNIRFRSVSTFVSSLAIEITQWKKNALGVPEIAGITRRDMQIHSVNTGISADLSFASYDSLGAPKGSPGYDGKLFKLCPGQTFTEILVAKSSSPADTTYFWGSWGAPNNIILPGLPGSNFLRLYNYATRSINGPRQDSFKLTWTMPLNAALNRNYTSVISFQTRDCPFPNRTLTAYTFITSTEAPALQILKTQLANRTYRLAYQVSNNVYINSTLTQWQIETAPASNVYCTIPADSISFYVFNKPGKFRIKLLPGSPCGPTEFVDTVEIRPLKINLLSIKGNTCYGDSAGSLMVNVSNYFNPVQYKIGNNSYQSSGSFDHLPAGNYWIYAKDSLQQKDSVLLSITQPAPIILHAILSNAIKCNGDGDGRILLVPENGIPPYTYKKTGGIFDSIYEHSNLLAGTYLFYVKDSNQCIGSVQYNLNQPAPIQLVQIAKKDESCLGKKDGTAEMSVSGGTAPFVISWQTTPIQYGSKATGLSGGTISVYVVDANQCTYLGSSTVLTRSVYNYEQICGVSMDSTSGKARIIWNKTSGKGTARYYVFKSASASGPFVLLDSVPFQANSILIDPVTLTCTSNKFYQLKAVDSCNQVSAGQTLHKPILGAATVLAGRVNLSWSKYVGKSAANLVVLRSTNGSAYSGIGMANQNDTNYIDSFPATGSNKYLLSLNGFICYPYDSISSLTPIYSNVMSANISTGLAKYSNTGDFEIYPNPTSGMITLVKKTAGIQINALSLYSLDGKVLKKWLPDTKLQQEVFDVSEWSEGLYYFIISGIEGSRLCYPIMFRQ